MSQPVAAPGGATLALVEDDAGTWLRVQVGDTAEDYRVTYNKALVRRQLFNPPISADAVALLLGCLGGKYQRGEITKAAAQVWLEHDPLAACRVMCALSDASAGCGPQIDLGLVFSWLPQGDVPPLAAALTYMQHGYPIVILHHIEGWTEEGIAICSCPKGADCKGAGKHPRVRGWRTAPQTVQQIVSWWARYPQSNVGLIMGGPRRLVTLDVDGACGAESLLLLEEAHGALPPTLTQQTGRARGRQMIFYVPEAFDLNQIRGTTSRVGDGLDVRANNGLIVVAPSWHKSRRQYQWTELLPIADLPEWLYNLMVNPPGAPKRSDNYTPGRVPQNAQRPADSALPPLLQRVEWATRKLDSLPPAIEGQGGSTATLRAAIVLVRGYCLPPDKAVDLLATFYNPRCVPPWTRSELEHKVASAENDVKMPWGFLLQDRTRSLLDRAGMLIGKEN